MKMEEDGGRWMEVVGWMKMEEDGGGCRRNE